MKKIGLFGGSFDPVHLGHLLVAQAALEELSLDRLVFIPAAQSPFKPDSRPLEGGDRLRLIRAALAGCDRFEVDDTEIREGGVSYTIDTIRRYEATHAEVRLYYLIGADHVGKLQEWKESADLARSVIFATLPRPGEPEHPVPAGFNLVYLSGFPLRISSSEIRDRLRRGKNCRFLLPPGVWEMILESKLYL